MREHSNSLRKMFIGLAFLLATCVLAVAGYTIAGWTLVDSLYMVIITIFGVGYGEVRPVDTVGLKIFTGLIIIAGCSSGIYAAGRFAQMIAEGEIQQALGVRRMSRGIEQTTGHVIICGYGRVGQMLAGELHELNEPFVCVDADPERIAEAEENGYLVVTGNAGEESTLTRAGVERARVLASVLPDDASNVFITLTARELSDDIEIIARGENMAAQRKLIRSGANHVVLPAAIGASKIANMISCPSPETLLTDPKQRERLGADLHTLGLSLREFPVPPASEIIGSTLKEIQGVDHSNIMIVAIRREDGTLLQNPGIDEKIQSGDKLFVVTDHRRALSLIKKLQTEQPEMIYRGTRSN